MEHYNIRIDQSQLANNDSIIHLKDFFIADDLSYVSGYTSPNITVVNDGVCMASNNNGQTFYSAKCDSSVVKRMGYIEIDGKRYNILDGKVTVGDGEYTATYIKNDTGDKFSKAYVLVGDVQYPILEGQQQQWFNTRNVTVFNTGVFLSSVIDAEAFTYQQCIELNNEAYDILWDSGAPYIMFEGRSIRAVPIENEEGTYIGGHEFIRFNDEESGIIGDFTLKSYRKRSVEDGVGLTITLDPYKNEWLDMKVGDFFKVYSVDGDKQEFVIRTDSNGDAYVDYYGIKYFLSADCKVQAYIDGNYYDVVYSGDVSEEMWVGTIKGYDQAIVSAQTEGGKVKNLLMRKLAINGNDRYWANEDIEFVSYSGITLDGFVYLTDYEPVRDFDNPDSGEMRPYIELPSLFKMYFKIDKVEYNSGQIDLSPVNPEETDWFYDSVGYQLGLIADRFQRFHFLHIGNLFGVYDSGKLVSYDEESFGEVFCLKPIETSISLKVPLSQANAINLNDEWNIHALAKERAIANVNGPTDVERDIYCPVYKVSNQEGEEKFLPITKIKFNLHFRTRNMEDWSINEDNVELMNEGKCNWNCLDHYFNEPTIDTGDNSIHYDSNEKRKIHADNIANCGDLLYFAGFTDKDVFYQKTALAKSFLRLSFFDSPVPNQQSLLWTSTVFFDEGEAFMKYINNRDKKDYSMFNNPNGGNNGASVMTEPLDEREEFSFDSNRRLAMELTTENKYAARVSSEGFYIYIYKEYSTALHERKIYMRADFNNAKTGKSQPMMLLRHYDENGVLTRFQANCSDDVFKAREGFPMAEMLNYIYLPIEVVYNEDLMCYTYHFESLVENETEELNINLFEVKYKDESK